VIDILLEIMHKSSVADLDDGGAHQALEIGGDARICEAVGFIPEIN
jgi:hypothetical protein